MKRLIVGLGLLLGGCSLTQSQPALLDATTIISCSQASQKINAAERAVAIRQLEICRGVLLAGQPPQPAGEAQEE